MLFFLLQDELLLLQLHSFVLLKHSLEKDIELELHQVQLVIEQVFLVNQEVVCFISFYIILWVIILLFFAKYLSLHRDIQPFAEYAVTPCMGVWIETTGSCFTAGAFSVTPCMGVWIETQKL